MTSTHPPPVGAFARRTRTITRHDIELFTEVTGDRNPIHCDAELAARSRFGGLVVQGGVTSGLLNALVAEQLPGPGSVFLEVTKLATRITNQDGVVVLDGTAVVWRDPVLAAHHAASAAPAIPAGSPAPHLEES